MSIRNCLGLFSVLLSCTFGLAACHSNSRPQQSGSSSPAPTSRSVGVALRQVDHLSTTHEYVKLNYPVVTGTAGTRLNPVIQKWIGARCPVPSEKPRVYNNAATCAAAFEKACKDLKKLYKNNEKTFGCTLDANSQIRLDAAGLLGVIYTTYAYTGGAHGNTVVSYLNLDIDSGKILQLNDLLARPDANKLSDEIEAAIRANRNIPASRSLKDAGFFVDKLPPADSVLALPDGLLFTYQSYEVGPYVLGQPHGVVPYAALNSMLTDNGPLVALIALGKRLAQDNPRNKNPGNSQATP